MNISVYELINSHPDTIFYWQWYYSPNGPKYKHCADNRRSMSQVGAKVNRYKQVVEVENE